MVTPATGLQTQQRGAVISSMHRSYQPLKPVTNRYLQQRWDQNHYENHRKKVRMKVEECRARVKVEVEVAHSALVSCHNIYFRNYRSDQLNACVAASLEDIRPTLGLRLPVQVSCSLPAVDNQGLRTPAHIQLKLKKLQVSRF